jgi:hypothetical protein
MKAFCYLVLIIGFFIFFQQSPVYAVMVIGAIAVGYLYIKSKRSQSKGGSGFLGLMKGNPQQSPSTFDDLVTLMMIQQLLGTNTNHKGEEIDTSHKEHIDLIKQEVLDLLDE